MKITILTFAVLILNVFGVLANPFGHINTDVNGAAISTLYNLEGKLNTEFQQKKVTGTITDENGNPMPGVNILVEANSLGVISDVNGKYSIEIPDPNTVLIFSFIGYNPEKVPVSGRVVIDIKLTPDVKILEEVVVIGYGTVKKMDLTGSVGTVSSEALVAKGVTSAMGALQGTIPGVNIVSNSARPGGGYSIKIRGQNSIEGGDPLYVVDGVVTSDIDFLNPADIDRIDILKDASSTAIYGSRGSNGVILVQTKNAGTVKSSGLSVSYDGYYGVRALARIPEFMDGREWMDYRTNAYYTWNTATKSYQLTNNNKNLIFESSAIISQRLYEKDYEDWIGLGTQNGNQQNHYVNISGNSNNISYNVGVGYQNEEGNFLNEVLKRYNTTVSVNHKASGYFMSGATVTVSQTTIDAGSEYGYREIMRLPDVLHAYDADGNLVPQPGIASVIEGIQAFTSHPNPLCEIQNGNQETRRYDIVASVFAQITPFEGLDIKSTLSPRLNRTRHGKYLGVVLGNRNEDYASSSNSESFDFTLDNQISYNKAIGSHHINGTFINSIYNTRFETLTVAAQNLPYKSYWYNIYSGTLVDEDNRSGFSGVKMLSYAGRVNYDFGNKYFGTATIRYDGSSKLANKWAAFPSFALAWRASEESFLKTDWLSNLKARFSFGYSGNNNGVNAYGTQLKPITNSNVYYDYNGTMVSGFAPGSPVNQSLTWEKTREINFGIDFGFLKDRISGTIDLYDKLSDGLLMARLLTIESGVVSMTDNIGSVSNKGIELSLSSVNVRTKDFFWSTSLSFAANKNAIISLYGKKEDVIGEARFIGEPINVIYDYKILGVWTKAEYDAGLSTYYNPDGSVAYVAKYGEAKTLDASGNGTLGIEDKVILGSPDPKWTGSFSSNMEFRSWDFSFSIFTNQGVFLLDEFAQEFGYGGARGSTKVKLNYYNPPDVPIIDWDNFDVDANGKATIIWGTTGEGNENADYPVYRNISGAYMGRNGNYKDASFVKVKNITLGYTLKPGLVRKVGIKNLRFYVNVINPLTFTKYVGWDPEYASVDFAGGNGPSNITYQLGINAKF